MTSLASYQEHLIVSVGCLPSHPTPIYSLKYEFIPRLDIINPDNLINIATVSSKNRRPTPTIRESSLKLGSSIHHTLQSANRKTNSRWRWAKEKDPDYVDSVIIEDDIPVESCSGDEDGNLKRPKRAIKRKRTPPSPPPLSPVIHDDISLREATPTSSPLGRSLDSAICLTFNIPQSFRGIDQSKNTSRAGGRWSLRNTVRRPQKHARKAPAPNHNGTGFLTLPPESRNKVYRLLFIAKKNLVFYFPTISASPLHFFGLAGKFMRKVVAFSTGKHLCF